MVSHPETGSDSPIGSDQDRGRDRESSTTYVETTLLGPQTFRFSGGAQD